MRKWQRIAVPLILLIVYFSFMMIFSVFFASSVVVMSCTHVVMILVCMLHHQFLGKSAANLVPPVGWLAMIVCLPVFWLLTTITSTYIFMLSETITAPVSEPYLFIFMCVILAPISEEFMFRGVVFYHLRRGASPWAAYLVSSAIFALTHTSVAQMYVGFLCGIFFAILYDYTGRLWVSMLAHGLYNSLVLVCSSFLVLPEKVFDTMVVIPANVILILILFAVMGYVIMKPSLQKAEDRSVSESAAKRDGGFVSMIREKRDSFLSQFSPRVGTLCGMLSDDTELVLQTEEGSCVFAGFVHELRGNEYSDVRNCRIVRNSGRPGIAQVENGYGSYLFYRVRR